MACAVVEGSVVSNECVILVEGTCDSSDSVRLVDVDRGRYTRPVLDPVDGNSAGDCSGQAHDYCYNKFQSHMCNHIGYSSDTSTECDQYVLRCRFGTVWVKHGCHQDSSSLTVEELNDNVNKYHRFWQQNPLNEEWKKHRDQERSEKPSKELALEIKEYRKLASVCFQQLCVSRVKRHGFEKFLSNKGYGGGNSQVYIDVYINGMTDTGAVVVKPDMTFSRCEHDANPCCTVNVIHDKPFDITEHSEAYDLQFALYKSKRSESSMGARDRVGKVIDDSCPYNQYIPPVTVDIPPVGIQSLCSMIHCVDIDPVFEQQISSVTIIEELLHFDHKSPYNSDEEWSNCKPVIVLERITKYQNPIDGIFQVANRIMNSYVYMVLPAKFVGIMEAATLKENLYKFYQFCEDLRKLYENLDTRS